MINSQLDNEYYPVQAITVYQNKDHKYYLETTSIQKIGDKYVPLASAPFKKETLKNVIRALDVEKDEFLTSKSLFPKNLIYLDQSIDKKLFIWHVPEAFRQVYFHSNFKVASGIMYCPGLIFKLEHQNLSVFAIKNKTVNLDTRLFIAPFPNLYRNGNVCMGNVSKPKRCKYLEDLFFEWEKCYWNSEFSGMLDQYSPTKSDYKGLLKELVDTNKKFPLKELKPHPSFKTIKSILNLC